MTTNSPPQVNSRVNTLYMSIELSATKWKLGFADRFGRIPRVRSLDAGDFRLLRREIKAAKKKGITERCVL